MRIFRARHALVAVLLFGLAGCKSGGDTGGSWWNPSPFKGASSTPQNPYPAKPSQLYAGSATSTPSSGITAGAASSAPSYPSTAGRAAGGSTLPSTAGRAGGGSPLGGTKPPANPSIPGAPSYPGTAASYTAPGAPARTAPFSPSGSTGGPGAGSATATDVMSPQRGYYELPPGYAGSRAGSGPPGSTVSNPYVSSGSTSAPADSGPFRSPSASTPRYDTPRYDTPRYDTPANRYGNTGARDPFLPNSNRTAGPDRSMSGSRGPGSPYDSSTAPATASRPGYPGGPTYPQTDTPARYDYAPRTTRPEAGTPGAPGPAPSGYTSPASDYRPGATGYNPPASDYRPGATGYNPPALNPFRAPTSSYNPSTVTPEDVPYRPGSVTGYPQRTNVAGSTGGATSPFASPGARSDTDVTPTTGYSSGTGSYLR